MGGWKRFFSCPGFFLLNDSWGGWGGICWDPRHYNPPCLMDSQLNTSAWCKPKFLQSHWHNVQRGGGTHSRKRCWCIGAHFTEELFCSLRWRLTEALGQCVNRLQRRPWVMSWQVSEMQWPVQSESVGFCRSHTEGHWQQSEWTREVFTLRTCNIVEGERFLLFFTVNETSKCCLFLSE